MKIPKRSPKKRTLFNNPEDPILMIAGSSVALSLTIIETSIPSFRKVFIKRFAAIAAPPFDSDVLRNKILTANWKVDDTNNQTACLSLQCCDPNDP